MSYEVRDRAYHERQKLQHISNGIAAQQAAQQAEIAHRSKSPKDFDEDEMLAACGLPSRPRRHQ